ncbi:MAG: DUF1016 N-terminal domain-containing protein [Psychrosphaera sp.]|nr:DUF1016 N-terminal domain-containing protein [Psychrosphaera sp.]
MAVNAELTLLYWQVGCRVSQEVLKSERADYGKQVVAGLAKSLTEQFGKGWSQQQLRHCLKFADAFAEEQIVYALRRQLSWTHLRSIIYIDDSLKREFYITMAVQERWSTCNVNYPASTNPFNIHITPAIQPHSPFSNQAEAAPYLVASIQNKSPRQESTL